MKPLGLLALSTLAIAACAPARTPPEPPAPVTAPAPPRTPPTAVAPPISQPVAPVTIAEAPRNWQLLDESIDHIPGISAERAERELLAGRQPKRIVVVAVIDGGVDTAHADLSPNLWRNPSETAGNAKDDDRDGYVDDARGWNFLGGPDGRDVQYERLEVTRLYARCAAADSSGGADSLPASERGRCPAITADYLKQKAEAEATLQQVQTINAVLAQALPLLRQAAGTDSLTTENVSALHPTEPDVEQARQIFLQLAANGITPQKVQEAQTAYETRVKYNLNPSYNPRPIVGDDPAAVAQSHYGNPDVMGPDALHGTHVAGIIAALGGNGVGIDGIAPAVRIMSVRAVPDGDERDKDIANAIRFAVDHGANIINMSFGKGYSPYKGAVDDAVKYADAHGVLMVHAAGNDGADLATAENYPKATYLTGGRAQNWIEVGASSWKGGDSLAAMFSNYGHDQVDVFAPGLDILSTVPGGYERESGTSMAAPVVSGLAALLMDYYPQLTAADVKHIILESAARHTDQQVVRPGSENGAKVPFGSLSATGGIVNAYNAIKMAEQMTAAKP